jgi:DNA-binding LacI/PurR family transcriptional regulator
LNDRSLANRISQETIDLVLEAAKKLNYQPNLTAGSLRGQLTYMLALMIPDIANPLFHSLVRTVQNIARQQDYDLLIANTDHLYDNELHFCKAITRRPVDGVLMVPMQLSNTEITTFLNRMQIPAVVLAGPDYYPDIDTVYVDDSAATYQVVKWLIDIKKHTSIGFIGPPSIFPPAERRYRSFCRAMEHAGLSIRPEFVQRSDYNMQGGRDAMEMILQQDNRPTAIVAYNDLMALGALTFAQEMNLSVPHDIAIIGFDNIPEAVMYRPQLTTIDLDAIMIGEQMAKMLFERIEGVEQGKRRVCELSLRFVERHST